MQKITKENLIKDKKIMKFSTLILAGISVLNLIIAFSDANNVTLDNLFYIKLIFIFNLSVSYLTMRLADRDWFCHSKIKNCLKYLEDNKINHITIED